MIAIKSMKMPNSCSECNLTFRKSWNYACSINLKDIDCDETKRPKDCPLIELVTCKDCKHRPVDDHSGSIEPPYTNIAFGTPIPNNATNKDVFKAVFGYDPATDAVVCNKEDWCGASDPCNYCTSNSNNIGREEDWWDKPYKEVENE